MKSKPKPHRINYSCPQQADPTKLVRLREKPNQTKLPITKTKVDPNLDVRCDSPTNSRLLGLINALRQDTTDAAGARDETLLARDSQDPRRRPLATLVSHAGWNRAEPIHSKY